MSIPLTRPYFSELSRKAILEDMDGILCSGRLITGPFQEKLETLFKEKMGMTNAIALNSCTTSLTVCLKYFDIRDREVLVPSGTFITSVTSILFAGGIPVLVDMNPETLSFDVNDLRRKITSRTKGIVWVHLTGRISAEADEILSLAKGKGLFVLEDCAHALGATIKGTPAGGLGDAGCFSFYPTKIISSGTGGMIATNNDELADFACSMRSFGKTKKTGDLEKLGGDYFLDEFRACVAYHQLEELEDLIAMRSEIANIYRRLMKKIPNIILPSDQKDMSHSYYQFPIFLKNRSVRKKLRTALMEKHGIECKKIYRPSHTFSIIRYLDDGSLDNTEETLERSLCLPIFPGLREEDVTKVVGSIKQEMEAIR